MALEERTPEERAEFTRTLKERLREWLDEEGFSSKKETGDEGSEFHYVIEYPQSGGVTIHLLRPKGRSVLVLLLGIHLSQPHAQAFKKLGPEEQRRLVHRIRGTAFSGGEVGFAPQMEDGVPARWQFDHLIYDDGISRHALFRGLKLLFSKHLEIVEVLNEELGGKTPGGAPATRGSGGSTGEDVKGYL